MTSLKSQIASLSDQPGVYRFCDKAGVVLYVGKAKSLKKRVSSYFSARKDLPLKIQKLVCRIHSVKSQVTSSEDEALILEDELIKNHQPMFNILLRDDKTYPFIFISTQEKFPRVLFSHRAMMGEGKYYGPYPGSRMVKALLTEIRKKYPYRDCPLDVGNKKYTESCLYDQLGLCTAPCIGKDSQKNYNEIINRICEFLDGKQKRLINDIYNSMMEASQKQQFEKAAKLKEHWKLSQKIFSSAILLTNAMERNRESGLAQLKEHLKLRGDIQLMEAYDISNISGELSVGVSVVFRDGRPYKSGYKRFRIKTIQGPNDFAMMEEVLRRRFQRVCEGKDVMPDLILIDGGKGQLSAALHALHELGLKRFNIIALAKKQELIYVPGRIKPIILERYSYARKLLQALRDEAHRFAITYHRTIRARTIDESILDTVPGVGDVIKVRILRRFGSIPKLQNISVANLAQVKGVSPFLALKIHRAIQRSG